ncbi:hypothetical protein [Microbulbifer sp. ZKSA002]|uniref:hypothetical protein n=1 Tax=Microbulbifer sp. ZKSA002 TaxID=3243388 RepID=UPI0040395A17
MGFFDSKKKTTNVNTTNDYTTTTTDNRYSELDLSEGSVGVTGDVSGNVTVNATDYGALASAQQMAMGAFDFGADALETGANLGVEALGVGGDALKLATGLSSEALGVGRDLASDAMYFSEVALSQTIDQVADSAETFAQLTQRSLEQTQSAYKNANTSEDGQISQQLILYMAVAAVIIIWIINK